mgnify:CR=1 FL=1
MRISALVFVCAALLLAWPVSAIALSDDVSALLERVEALYDQGKYEEAIPLAERTLSLDHPSVATGFNNLAEFYRIQGRYIDAELLYERAVEF